MNAGLKYGPVGKWDAKDPFEWAQARMPEGWHVEGQVLPTPRLTIRDNPMTDPRSISWWAMATSIDRDRIRAVGYSPGLALANLVRKVNRARAEAR